MPFSPRICRIALLSVASALCLTSMVVRAEADMPGARDPAGVARYPRSWIVDYAVEPDGTSREFIVTRVDRIRRDLRVQNLRRVNADLEAATYQIATGTRLEDIVAHYLSSIGGDLLFRCSGRDCGRSNDWANQVFHQAILYGPDSKQHYLALQRDNQLLALYVIERGNKRIYAHLQVLSLVDEPILSPGGVRKRLAEQGWILIPNLQPQSDGQLPETAVSSLTTIADEIKGLPGQLLYVVCHISAVAEPGVGIADVDTTSTLVNASQNCADQAVVTLNTRLPAAGPELRGFGVGPLAPRRAASGSRLEIVDPAYRSTP